jgi:hypothetical protein
VPSELQPRHGLRARLAGLFSKDPAPGDLPPGAVVISETPVGATTPLASASAGSCATCSNEPAKPGDWRQSWGKLDTSKTDMTAVAKPKAPETPKADVMTASNSGTSNTPKMDPSEAAKPKTDPTALSLPKMPAPSFASAPPPPPLPTVDSKGSDPLKDPTPYTRHGTDDKTPAVPSSKPWSQGVADAGPAARKDESAPGLPSFGPTDPGQMPPGSKSVLDSGSSQYVPVPIVTVPDYRRPPQPPAPHVPQPPEPNYVDMSNAFTNPSAAPPSPQAPPPPQAGNAFSPTPSPVETNPAVAGAFGMPVGGSPAAGMYPPPGYGGPRAPGMVPPGMMPPGYAGMMPRGMYPQMPYGPAMPAMYQPNPGVAGQPIQQMSYSAPVGGMGAGPQVAMATPPVNLLPAAGTAVQPAEAMATLRDSIYPSQREWSAGQLASLDWHTHGDAVQALATAAREDPAPLVRAACVRALGRMGCNSAPVLNTLQALKTDGDPRVLHEVEQALASLAPEGGGAAHGGVVPAGARVPH